MTRSTLCGPCLRDSQAWLDYRLPPRLSFTYGSGTPYDSSPAGVRDARRARFEEWRDTVRFHRDLIARACREQHGPTGGSSPSASPSSPPRSSSAPPPTYITIDLPAS